MIKQYVLFDINFNKFLSQKEDKSFELVDKWKDGLILNSKEQCLSYLDRFKKEIIQLSDSWTTREFIKLNLN